MSRSLRARTYLLTGILTAIPLLITVLVFDFVVGLLSRFGTPWVKTLSKALSEHSPQAASWLVHPWFQNALSVLVTLAALYVLGWFASKVVGRRLVGAFDALMERLPMIKTVYGATKKLVNTLNTKPDKVQRVVLIDFPSPEMKTIGFVTRVLKDKSTGRELAAVYVPTTPNPTSGYVEIVPVDKLTPTDWNFEQAMSFIVSGGSVAPDTVDYEAVATMLVKDKTAPIASPAVGPSGSGNGK